MDIDCVDVSLVAEEKFCNSLAIVLGSNDERCVAVLIANVHRNFLPVNLRHAY